MSMKLLIMRQFAEVFGAYAVLVLLLPCLVFYRNVRKESLETRLMVYMAIGNCYMMAVVFIMGLFYLALSKLHIPVLGTGVIENTARWDVINRRILWIVLIASLLLTKFRLKRVKRSYIVQVTREYTIKIVKGTVGIKSFFLMVGFWAKKQVWFAGIHTVKLIRKNIIDAVLFLGLVFLLLLVYGRGMFQVYGYTASDMLVHTNWVNDLSQNHIFSGGVYPFGFHCIVYYLHTVFHLDTFVVFRVFSFVQTLFIHLSLLLFLKNFCKSRYLPYGAMALYIGGKFFYFYTYSRFYSTLPQEFGMIFILPAVYFLIGYFRIRKQELARVGKPEEELARVSSPEKEKKEGDRGEGKETEQAGKSPSDFVQKWRSSYRNSQSLWYMVWFALSVSLTLSAHFYDTIIAALFCIAVVVSYGLRFVRLAYLKRLLLGGGLGILLALLPMLIAFALGTPLQGSLAWGMKVAGGSIETGSTDLPGSKEAPSGKKKGAGAKTPDATAPPKTELEKVEHALLALPQKIGAKTADLLNKPMQSLTVQNIEFAVQTYVFPSAPKVVLNLILYAVPFLLLEGLVFFLLKKRDEAALLASAGIFLIFMLLLQAAKLLGLPPLLDANRCRIYLSYMLPVFACFALDGILILIFGRFKRKWILPLCSLPFVLLVTLFLVRPGELRETYTSSAEETNTAIVCLSNILKQETKGTWTIVSAFDEARLAQDYGYHYELMTFLQEMESPSQRKSITIPTPKVYFFIEKIPLAYDYSLAYAGAGSKVSQSVAQKPMPNSVAALDFTSYIGESRLILMSKMYYWAKKFSAIRPNEMQVYLETDEFICYVVEQNTDRLLDFSIDYGYND
ncbi:hypothetical protein FACS1894111_06690 [Clostridia bacterium]|nr:hypothetical protein FACS1894111_06690 [Clostridia bacterium]